MSDGLCACGCGRFAPISRRTWTAKGLTRGQPKRFIAGHNTKQLTHGHTRGATRTPEYSAWKAMRHRCENPNDAKWALYGGAGITVCPRWAEFESFLSDVGYRPGSGYSLDRYPDNSGNYEPGNVRWATIHEQNRNLRTNPRFSHNGLTLCVAEWAEKYGLRRDVLRQRLNHGWSIERALSEPVNGGRI